jgi:hypothetical protein
MPGSPRSESPIVHGLEGLQRHTSSLSNFRERFGSRIHLSKLLRVGRGLCLLSLVRLEIFVVLPEHLLVAGLNLLEGGESPEIFKGCVDFTLLFTQFPNLLGNLSIAQGHLIMDKEKSVFSSMHISTKTILLCTSLFVANAVEFSRELKRLKKLKKEQDANV